MNTNNDSVNNNDSLNNNSQTLYFGFSLLKSYQLDGRFFKLNHVGYNRKKRKLVGLDSMGILTVFTGKFALATSHLIREKNFPKYTNNYYKNLLYCEKYGIYLALNKNSRIEILNELFQLRYVMPSKYNKESILFIAYNSVTENVITQVRSGTVIWKLSFNIQQSSPFSFIPFDYHKTLKGKHCSYMFLCEPLQYLYICARGRIFVYLCKSYSFLTSWRAHDKTITCMEYSPYANVIASASEDLTIKIWSNKGFHIFTFKGHSRPVVSFTIHPRYRQLLFSGSADGAIKVWSLESFQLFYSTHTLMDCIEWMGAAHSGWMWCGSRNEVQLYDFNICGGGLWGRVGGDVDRFFLAEASDRTRQIVAVAKDSSARIYCETSTGIQQRAVSTLLPIPLAAGAGSGVFCITYSRINNLFYVLVNPQKIWIYTSKTDPSSRIGEWDVNELQSLGYVESSWNERHSLPHGNAATVCNKDKILSIATCLTTAYSPRGFQFAHFSGTCSALCRNVLLIGLSNGKVLFTDQMIKNRIYLELVAHNRTIMDVKMTDKLVTLSDMALVIFQIWSVPELFLLTSVQVGGSLTAYDFFGNYLASGFSDGAMMLTYLDLSFETKGTLQVISSSSRTMMRKGDDDFDRHDGKILSISSCLEKSVFGSTSVDRTIKIWNLQRSLITAIHLDATLTSCLFLNATGDMLIGWKNDIFKILYSKWLPPNHDAVGVMQVQSVSSASTNIFHLYAETEGSSVYYDENEKSNDLDVNQTPTREDITLAYYLKPYRLSVKENDLHVQILKNCKNKSGRDECEDMYKDYIFQPPVDSHHMKEWMKARHTISSHGYNDGDENELMENAKQDAKIVSEGKPPEKVEIYRRPMRKKDVQKPIQTLIGELSDYVYTFADTVKKMPRTIIPSENSESQTNLRKYFGIFPVIANQPPFGQSRAFGEIMLGKILDKKNTPQTETDDVICEKGVEIPINGGGGGDQLKLIRGGGESSTGVGEALKKNRLIRSKVAKSIAFVTAKQRTRTPSKRITHSSIAFLGPTTNPPLVSNSQDPTPLKIEASRADIIDTNENVTGNSSNNSVDVGRPVSEIRMVYRNRNESTPEKPKEDQANTISDFKGPSKDEMIKADEDFCEKGNIIEGDLSSSDLYAKYKKDGLQFDGDWQDRMVERHQLLQEQRRQRQQLAASKRLYIESEKTVATVNAHYRRASNNTRPMSSISRSRPSTAIQPINSTHASTVFPVSSRSSVSRSGSDTCLRYRLSNLDSEDNNISTPVASFNSFAEHQMQLPPHRPPSSCSIPSKMSYVLVDLKKRSKPQLPTPTKMERELLSMRFPSRYQLLQRSLYMNSKSADQSNNNKSARPRPNTSVNLASQRNLNTSHNLRQRAKSAGISMNGSFNSPLISVLHRKKQFYKPTKFGSYQ